MLFENNKTREELDTLIEIGRKFCDNQLSESLISDVLQSLKNKPQIIENAKEYLTSKGIEIVPSFYDVDDSSDDSTGEEGKIIPFDPSKIDISPKTLSLDILLNRLENDEIDLMPGFQRKIGLWKAEQKSQLIESLILRIPLPAFYFDGTDNNKWLVIDGLQRLSALREFFVEKTLKLKGLEFLKDLEGISCDEMPKVYLRRMRETLVICYIINPGAPVNLKYNIFKRINTGGLNLEPQEIRHALYQGYSTNYLRELADSDLFKRATGFSVPSERMMDREFVLRFIAFYELGVDKYDGRIDDFLIKAMELINTKYKADINHSNEIKVCFNSVLNLSLSLFDKYAFRRMPDKTKRRTISKALFETWTVVLAKRTYEEQKVLVSRKSILEEKYMPMFTEDEEFYNSIGSGKVSSVKKRFEKINSLIDEVINYAEFN